MTKPILTTTTAIPHRHHHEPANALIPITTINNTKTPLESKATPAPNQPNPNPKQSNYHYWSTTTMTYSKPTTQSHWLGLNKPLKPMCSTAPPKTNQTHKLHGDPSTTHHKPIGTNHNHRTQIHFKTANPNPSEHLPNLNPKLQTQTMNTTSHNCRSTSWWIRW